MAQQAIASERVKAWLLFRSGPQAGTRFPIADGTTRVGRAPDNDVVVSGSDAAIVSLNHLEIVRDASILRVRDLNSTNGTWLNGERVTETEVCPPAILQLGVQGPEFEFLFEQAAAAGLDQTIRLPSHSLAVPPAAAPVSDTHESLRDPPWSAPAACAPTGCAITPCPSCAASSSRRFAAVTAVFVSWLRP